jgi:hypothetical protein
MNQTYLDTARLLTQVAPLVFVDARVRRQLRQPLVFVEAV